MQSKARYRTKKAFLPTNSASFLQASNWTMVALWQTTTFRRRALFILCCGYEVAFPPAHGGYNCNIHAFWGAALLHFGPALNDVFHAHIALCGPAESMRGHALLHVLFALAHPLFLASLPAPYVVYRIHLLLPTST